MEGERAVDDAEMARRLQSTFDNEFDMEKADEDLARQLREEEDDKERGILPEPPPLTSVVPTSGPSPINAHHPRPPLTSLLPTTDYERTIQQTRFSDPTGREGQRDFDDDDNEWEQGKREREKVRERREREREREKEREREREWEREREKERQREEDMLLTERLQMEERERLTSEVARDMERSQQNNVEVERESSDHAGEMDDKDFAYELQREEVEKVRIALEKKKLEMRDAELMIRMNREEIELGKEKIAEKNALIRSLSRRIELSEEEESGYGGATAASDGHWERKLYTRHGGEFGADSRLESSSRTPPPRPPPPPSPIPTSGIPGLEPRDNSEEPRPKPIPRPRLPEEKQERIPCQFCHKTFTLAVIMYHQVMRPQKKISNINCLFSAQQKCGAHSGYEREEGRGRGRGRTTVEVNLEEVLREEQTTGRERDPGQGREGAIYMCHGVSNYFTTIYLRECVQFSYWHV